MASAPSDKAVEAGDRGLYSRWPDLNSGRRGGPPAPPMHSEVSKEALLNAHDPALGVDRSVCLRDVVERALEGEARSQRMVRAYFGMEDLGGN